MLYRSLLTIMSRSQTWSVLMFTKFRHWCDPCHAKNFRSPTKRNTHRPSLANTAGKVKVGSRPPPSDRNPLHWATPNIVPHPRRAWARSVPRLTCCASPLRPGQVPRQSLLLWFHAAFLHCGLSYSLIFHRFWPRLFMLCAFRLAGPLRLWVTGMRWSMGCKTAWGSGRLNRGP